MMILKQQSKPYMTFLSQPKFNQDSAVKQNETEGKQRIRIIKDGFTEITQFHHIFLLG